MRITKIKRLVSFGNMENISMECEVYPGDSVSESANYLESEIKKQIHIINEKEKSEDEAYAEKRMRDDGDDDDIPF